MFACGAPPSSEFTAPSNPPKKESTTRVSNGSAPGVIGAFDCQSTFQQWGGFGRDHVILRRGELRPDTGQLHFFPDQYFSTAYKVSYLHGRFTEHVYVVGEYPGGRTVLERWTLFPASGSYTIDRPAQLFDIGVPVNPDVPPALVVVDDIWVAPEDRTRLPQVRRELIDDSLYASPIQTFEVDPDGRFIRYIGTAPAGVYQLVMAGPPSAEAVLLFDDTDIPQIGNARGLNSFQHPGYGRVYSIRLGAFDGDRMVLLTDGDNDGVFDSPIEVTKAVYKQEFHSYTDPAEDFVHYDW